MESLFPRLGSDSCHLLGTGVPDAQSHQGFPTSLPIGSLESVGHWTPAFQALWAWDQPLISL